ncbi:hypothetical protein PInf_001124 [Phytophthora infestans]|nr:hypothetical protein PInf_001124 [Phytophthora infestans]
MAVPEDDVVTKSGENHAWLHRGDEGCYRGSQRWPRCKSYRHLEQDQPDDANEILAKEDGERNAPWHRRRGGCFQGHAYGLAAAAEEVVSLPNDI